MKTRTTPNITSTAKFPPLNKTIKNNLSNDMLDGLGSNKKLGFQLNKQNNKTKEHQSKECNKESNKQKNINKVQNKKKYPTKTNKLNLIRKIIIKANKVNLQRKLKVDKKINNTIFQQDKNTTQYTLESHGFQNIIKVKVIKALIKVIVRLIYLQPKNSKTMNLKDTS